MIRKPLIFLFILSLGLLFAAAHAEDETESERWYAIYYKGKKVGRGHTEFTDYTEEGAKFRKIETKSYAKITGTASYTSAKVSASKQWDVEITGNVKSLIKNDKVVQLKIKSKSDHIGLRAKGEMQGDTLVIQRREGVLEQTLKIKPGDYDMTSNPMHVEPFLATVTDKPVVKNVFLVGSAEIKPTTYTWLKDGKTKDVDGVEKPCKVYKVVDDETEVILKTVQGRVVYIKSTDIKDKRSVVWRWTSKKKATSDTGY